MKKVPKMLSTKDVSYIKDIFNWNIIAKDKINYYLKEIEDSQMQELFSTIANMHYEICESLVSILESGDNDE